MKKALVFAILITFCICGSLSAAVPATADLRRMAQAGASLVINASSYSPAELVQIAQALQKGATLTIQNASSLNTAQCLQIIHAQPGQVIFWF